MSGSELFTSCISLIPIYGLLIWGYINPEESHFFGRRWMYEKEPELSEEAIWLHKKVIIIMIIVLTFILLLYFDVFRRTNLGI